MTLTTVLGRRFMFLFLIAAACAGMAAAEGTSSFAADYYVSPEGNDAWSGALADATGTDGPFRTLTRARDAVRARIAGGMERDIVVALRGGVHVLRETLVLGLADSGRDGHLVIYRNYPQERPILSSGVPITGWEKVDGGAGDLPANARGNVWVADVPAGLGRFRTLYQGERLLPRARGEGFAPLGNDADLTGVIMPFYNNARDTVRFPGGALMKAWDNMEDVELIVRPSKPWLMNILPLKSVDLNRNIATTAIPATYPMLALKRHEGPSIWVENVIEALDEPGEWVLNTKTKKLYWWPEDAGAPSDILAPALREYIRVEGEGIERYWEPDTQPDRPAGGIHFIGLAFTHGDRGVWRGNDAGMQHDWEMLDTDNAMLRFRGARECLVDACEFYNAGGNAIRMDLYAQENTVRRSHFHGLGQSSVVMMGYGPGTKDVNHHNTVENNHIHHNGQLYWHSQQVIAWQSGGNRIAHNDFHDLPRKAICLSGVRERYFKIPMENDMDAALKNWRECGRSMRWFEMDLEDASHARRVPYLHARNNVVEYNKAVNCSLMLGDGAVINCSGAGDGNVFRYNIIRGINNGNAMMRSDDDQENMTWFGNILVEPDGAEGGACIITKGGNTLRNNIIIGRILLFKGWPMNNGVYENNIFYIPKGDQGEFYGKFMRDLSLPEINKVILDNNLYFHEGAGASADDAVLNLIRDAGYDAKSLRGADPRIVDWENGDYRLESGSPALALGFQQIPVDRIGVMDGFTENVEAPTQGRRSGRNQPADTNRNQSEMSTEDLMKLSPEGVTVIPDIAYREGNEAWKLDLAMPEERGDAPRPAVIYIHGGGWTKGDKRGKGIGTVLGYAAKGFVSMSVNYRLDVDKKACVEDVKCAVRWLRAHAEQYNVDPNRIGAAGNSAGAHLALMLAVCPPSAGLEGDGPYQEYSSMVQAAHCGSTPIMPGFRGSRGKGANPDVKKIQPMTYISADVPPLYFIHGTLDTKAPVRYVDEFVKGLREAGAKDITYKRYDDGTGHGAYVKHIEEARPAREAFLARTLRK